MGSSSAIGGSVQLSTAITMLEVANRISQQIASITAQAVEAASGSSGGGAELGSSFGLGLILNTYA